MSATLMNEAGPAGSWAAVARSLPHTQPGAVPKVALCPPCLPSGSGRFILELWEGTGKEKGQVVERWESPWFPSTMEPARVLARIGHHRTNSEGSDSDQARRHPPLQRRSSHCPSHRAINEPGWISSV
jgi:hypothetical protein